MVPIHPAALVFPELPEEEYRILRDDIQANGQLVPIVMLDGQILDGRHRARACVELGIKILCDEITDLDGVTPEQFVWSLNGNRRHIKPSARAAIFAELFGEQKEQAAKKRLATKSQPMAKLPQAEKGTAREAIAKLADVSPRTVQDVLTVAKSAPELLPEIKAGKVTASKAAKQVREKTTPKASKPTKPSTLASDEPATVDPESLVDAAMVAVRQVGRPNFLRVVKRISGSLLYPELVSLQAIVSEMLGDDLEPEAPVAIPTVDDAVACVQACSSPMVALRKLLDWVPESNLLALLEIINCRLEMIEEGGL